MDPKWYPSANRPQGNLAGFLAIGFGAQVASNYIERKALRAGLALPVYAFCAYQLRTHKSGVLAMDYLFNINLFWLLLRWIDQSILNDPAEFVQLKDKPSSTKSEAAGRHIAIDKKSTISFKRNLGLCTTYRGIGWNWQVKNVDPIAADMSRSKFIAMQLLKAGRCVLISDIMWYFLRVTFPNRQEINLSRLSPLTKALVCWTTAVRGATDMNFPYYIASILMVATGVSKPQDWPPLFGSWRQAYTLRKAWGYCWHQMLRRMVEVYPAFAAKKLGIPKGSWMSRYFKLYAGFAVSALIHFVGLINMQFMPGGWKQVLFFMAQPCLITVEDFAIHVGNRLGLKSSRPIRFLGYLWIFGAFSLTLPLNAEGVFHWTNVAGNGVDGDRSIVFYSLTKHFTGT